jgi:hypothetical protein
MGYDNSVKAYLAVALLVAVPTAARADATTTELLKLIQALASTSDPADGTNSPHIEMGRNGSIVTTAHIQPFAPVPEPFPEKVTWKSIGTTADGKAAWVCADIALTLVAGIKPQETYMTLLVDLGKPIQPIAVAHTEPGTDAEAIEYPPLAIPRGIEPGAEDAATQFETTIGEPKALAATVSDRKEVVLYGSNKEKIVGGAQVKAKLSTWGRMFKVRDGVQAGLSGNKQIAWIAANVDMTPKNTPTAKPVPYRALFLYEKTTAGWMLVAAHFSTKQGLF